MRFDQKAFQYHDKASIQKEVADWFSQWIDKDCSRLAGLELGAGTGLFTRHLALRGFHELCATDISQSMLNEGKTRLPNVRWEIQDAWRLEARKADRVYACSLLQWATDPIGVLSFWRDALLEDGRLLACFFISFSGNQPQQQKTSLSDLEVARLEKRVAQLEQALADHAIDTSTLSVHQKSASSGKVLMPCGMPFSIRPSLRIRRTASAMRKSPT